MLEFDWTVSISLLISLFAMGFAWFKGRRKDLDEKFHGVAAELKDGSDRMTDLERRIARAEQSLETIPGKDELHRVELAIRDMAGDIKAMTASQRSANDMLRRLDTVVTRHEDHLLDTKK